jgi:hypothetical protein
MAFEIPPPGAGLVTVTAVSPAEAILEAGIAAVNCAEFTKVVATAPPKLTVEDALKFVPLTVSMKAAPPAGALFGAMLMTVGVRLDWLGGGSVALLPHALRIPSAQMTSVADKGNFICPRNWRSRSGARPLAALGNTGANGVQAQWLARGLWLTFF